MKSSAYILIVSTLLIILLAGCKSNNSSITYCDIQNQGGVVLAPDANNLKEFIGQPAVNFVYSIDSAGALNFSEIIKEKRLTILNFWASWCNPCLKEFTTLKALYSDYSGKGLEIIGVSCDSDIINMERVISHFDIKWKNSMDYDNILSKYNVRYIPRTLIIDENGYVIAEDVRESELSEIVYNYFN